MVRTDRKEVDVVRVSSQGRDRRARSGHPTAHVEPAASPAAVGVPPDTVNSHVRAYHEEIEMIRIARDRGN
jgi:hypothetical protein